MEIINESEQMERTVRIKIENQDIQDTIKKGKYVRTKEIKEKISKSVSENAIINPNYGFRNKKHSEESKLKMSKTRTGRTSWNKGKTGLQHHTQKSIDKIRAGNLNKKVSEETKNKIRLANLGKHLSEETKRKIGAKCSITTKQLWQNPEYREKVIKNTLKSLFIRPTSLEKRMINIIQKYNLPYKYTGDGSFLIGWKNPDFINTNGKKICVEVRPKCMCHIWNKCSPNEYEKKQKEHYSKYGWKCIVVWEEELNEKNIVQLGISELDRLHVIQPIVAPMVVTSPHSLEVGK